MSVIDIITERACKNPSRVAFPEATDEVMLQAVREATDRGVCIPVLVGDAAQIKEAADASQIKIDDMEIFDTTDEEKLEELITRYVATHPLASAKGMRRKSGRDSMYAALMLTAMDDCGAMFAGLNHTTGDIIMAGQLVVGMREGVETVSSIGIWEIPGYEGSEGNMLGHGDAAVSVNPTAEELASNAICAAETVQQLLGWEPRVALLSFSTDGSADHPMVDKVREAVRIANEKRPDLAIDGEFQLDAAISPKVAAKKVKRESKVAGRANFVLFPDINAGNIGVKLVQQFAKATAPGPFLLGLDRVVGDCSRGAPVAEIVGNIAACSVRAQKGDE